MRTRDVTWWPSSVRSRVSCRAMVPCPPAIEILIDVSKVVGATVRPPLQIPIVEQMKPQRRSHGSIAASRRVGTEPP
ncbi:hypothetical protein BN381_130363 [Candidatus Microthrix parvicella RN1]|uniref:Uncharacterized protein n=1 Tax=Candidatus Neomicrothrix parvicella RN1 TaxID=1229780 RepID=R4YXE1_9ACTN|nr:hypothetical protein BN381_130363 [Candidatus Microthrix parvicella RN1]